MSHYDEITSEHRLLEGQRCLLFAPVVTSVLWLASGHLVWWQTLIAVVLGVITVHVTGKRLSRWYASLCSRIKMIAQSQRDCVDQVARKIAAIPRREKGERFKTAYSLTVTT